MKNISAVLFLVILSVISCKKAEKSLVEKPEQSPEQITKVDLSATDSVKIVDSLKVSENLTAGFKSTVLVFPNLSNKMLLDSIYAPVNMKLEQYSRENITTELNTQKKAYYDGVKKSLEDWAPDFPQTWEQNSYMKMLSLLNDYITVQYKADGYTGGAHGYYNELYRVYDVKTNKQITLADILKVRDAKIWSRILMDQFLKNDLERGQAEMLLVKEIPLNDNFYFDQNNLYFLYNQYEIAAYAAGPVLIKIPYTEIKPFLTQDFRTKLNLK